jgi:hypothetical protein
VGQKQISLKDVGPIQDFSVPVPERGGVIEISGRNGSGKSIALSAIVALVTGEGSVSVRDGAQRGSIEGLGVRMTFGRRTAHSGEFELHALEGPDPSMLVDPGIKDRAAAHAERIRALCKLAHAEVNREAFVALLGGPDKFARIVKPESLSKGDVPSVAAAVKRDIELAARTAEAQSDTLQTEARGIASAAQDVPETETPDERAMQQELESASAALGELRGRQSQADALRKSADRARETLATFGDKGSKEAGQAAESALLLAKTNTAAADDHLHVMGARVAEAREALHAAESMAQDAKARLMSMQAHEKEAAAAVDQAFQDFTRRKQLAQASKAADVAADVDPEERQSTARVALQRAEVVRRAMEQRARAKGKADQAGEAMSRAHALRDAARGCEQIVTDALAKVCPAGMRVEGGFLVVDTDRGAEPFDELSHGERWTWALDISGKTIPPPGLLVCRQEGWEALDPTAQRKVAAEARERNLRIYAARASDGPLTVTLIGEEPAGQEQAA